MEDISDPSMYKSGIATALPMNISWPCILAVILGAAGCTAFRGITQSCSNMLRASSIMQKQWNLARNELNMPDFQFPTHFSRERLDMIDFYTFSNGVGLYNISNRAVTYAKIWKAGNEAIRANLYAEECKSINAIHKRPFVQHEHKQMTTFRSQLWADFHIDRTDVFTFGRHPVSHFESGLAEYYFRCFRSAQVTVAMIKDIIRNMLNFKALTINSDQCVRVQRYSVKHVFAMAGAISAGWNVKYIGQLEMFDRDWDLINQQYGMNITFNHKVGLHESSLDVNGVRKAFRALITSPEGTQYLRALCHVLLVDFVCFDYKVPLACQNMTSRS